MNRFLFITVSTVALLGVANPSIGALFVYSATMDGPSEAPPNASPGTGTALVEYDDAARTLRVQASFTGLTAGVTAAHIHGPTAVAETGTASVITTTPTFAGFPSGVTSGVYDNTLDLTLASSWNPAYITANGGTPASAEAAFAAALAEHKTYFNIHTSAFTGGEIRGFLVPEPAATALAAIGTILLFRRRRGWRCTTQR